MSWGHFILDEYFDDDMNVSFDATNVVLEPVMLSGNDVLTISYYIKGKNIRSGLGWVNVGSALDSGTRHYMYGDIIDLGGTFGIAFLSKGEISYITYSREFDSVSIGWDGGNHLGPQVLQFSKTDPFTRRAVILRYTKSIWKNEYDEKFDFFGKEFFRNDVDKLRFMSMMQMRRRDISLEDLL